MHENFEFDKIVLAIAFGLLAVILSNAIGGFMYRTYKIIEKRGYQIEIVDSVDTASVVATLPEVIDIAKIMAQASVEEGKKIFSKCAICHTPGKNEPNKVGPNLWGIVNANVARHQDFKYSEAMQKRSDKLWSFEELYRYLFSPKNYVVGTKMAFAGIKNDKERANLIAYLSTLSDTPISLPKED